MMTVRIFTRLYDDHDDALAVVAALEQAGFGHSDISFVAPHVGDRYRPAVAAPEDDQIEDYDRPEEHATGEALPGAGIGAAVVGGVGLLAGLGVIAIPGIGPVIAAGWLAPTMAGAVIGGAAGGLIGSLVHHAEIPEEDAHLYAESLRRGSTLVTVRADEAQTVEIEHILSQRTAVDATRRRLDYHASGWTRFDEARDEAPHEPVEPPPT